MASTLACASCGNLISKKAAVCPKCQHPHPKNLGHCRACKGALPISAHRYVSYSTGVLQGNSTTSSFVMHIPCKKCGDPKPLEKFRDTPTAKLVRFLIVIPAEVVAFVAFAAYFLEFKNFFAILALLGLVACLGTLNYWLKATR